MSTPRNSSGWLSPFHLTGRSLRAPPSDSDASSVALPNQAILLSGSREKGDIGWYDVDHDADQERKEFSSLRPHPLFDRAPLEDSPRSSPSISDTPSDDDDFEPLVPLQHPRPTPDAMRVAAPLHFALEDDNFPDDLEGAGVSAPDKETKVALSPTPSLVPTIIASRSPSPMPHPCVADAEALKIKVRDFAYEQHGIALARPVPDIQTLRARYELYRSADLTPPPEIVETLRDYDEAWLAEKKLFFDEREWESHLETTNTCPPWRPKGKVWCGVRDDESVAMGRSTSKSCDVDDTAQISDR